MHQDVIRQLSDMGTYLDQYGLKLTVFEKMPCVNQFVSSSAQSYSVSSDVTSLLAPTDDRHKTVFEIPREFAGSIIGKSAVHLKDLQLQFGCKIRLETSDGTETKPTREVLVWHNDEAVREAVKSRIHCIVAASRQVEVPAPLITIEAHPPSTPDSESYSNIKEGVAAAVP